MAESMDSHAFTLRNGQPVSKMIEVGRNNAHPAGNPFIVNF